MEIKDKVGAKNVVADHLSGLTEERQEVPLNDAFPDKHFLAISTEQTSWFADIINYLALGVPPHDLFPHKKKKYFWEEPFLCTRMVFSDVVSPSRRFRV